MTPLVPPAPLAPALPIIIPAAPAGGIPHGSILMDVLDQWLADMIKPKPAAIPPTLLERIKNAISLPADKVLETVRRNKVEIAAFGAIGTMSTGIYALHKGHRKTGITAIVSGMSLGTYSIIKILSLNGMMGV